MKETSITIIIPAYNEEGAITDTINRIKILGVKMGWKGEVIVVNDGSTDNTSKIANSLGAKVIDHPTNGGYGLSLQHGIEMATGDLIAITDADGTYPIEKLPELVRMVEIQGYDMAVGTRTGSEHKKGLFKYPARILFRWLAEYVAGRRIPDINSGLRVMKKEKLLPHYKRTCLGFSFTTSITLIFFLNGYFVGYMPIPYEKRVGNSKVRHFRDSLRTAQIMISVISYYNPLKLFLLIAILSFIGACLLFLIASITKIYILTSIGIYFIGSIPVVLALGCVAELLRLSNSR